VEVTVLPTKMVVVAVTVKLLTVKANKPPVPSMFKLLATVVF